jgi:hypothetical protein
MAGNALMPGVGGIVGGIAGNLLGQGVKYFTGFGDYRVKSNVLINNPNGAIINRNIHGGTVIRKTEYLGDLYSSPTPGLFTSRAFNLNPADETCFPWLSQIAANYEEYVLEGCYFEFRSMSADALNSTNTALGTVCLSAQYNVNSPDFTSKQEMQNHEFGISVKPSESVRYFVECKKDQSVLGNMYIRAPYNIYGEQETSDRRFSDICKFQIGSQGLQGANVNLGEIHVTYQVALLKSRMWDTLGNDVNCWNMTNTTGISNVAPFGATSSSVISFDNIGIEQSSTVQISFPIGYNSSRKCFIMDWLVLGNSTAGVTLIGSTLTSLGATITPLYTSPENGNTTGKIYRKWKILLDGAGSQINLVLNMAAATLPAAITLMQTSITQVPLDYIFN